MKTVSPNNKHTLFSQYGVGLTVEAIALSDHPITMHSITNIILPTLLIR
jgi:hypothetical protein